MGERRGEERGGEGRGGEGGRGLTVAQHEEKGPSSPYPAQSEG